MTESAGGESSRAEPVGITSLASRYSVADTVERLRGVIAKKGLTLFTIVDHSGEAARVGLKMDDTKLLIFGSPKAGTLIMQAAQLAALDLPLKALVWQEHGGRVLVSYNTTAYLAQRHGISAELAKNIAGIDALIQAALA
jgi:uncharacterized protein (DUF302 family)